MLTSHDSGSVITNPNGLVSLTPDSASSSATNADSSSSPSSSSPHVFNFNHSSSGTTFQIPVQHQQATPTLELNSKTSSSTSSSSHKTVCFHSITGQPGSDRKITNAIDCLQYMINGTTLIKVKASMRQYRRFYTLEEDLSMIRWVPSTKKTSKARLPVKSIREVRPGKNTEVLKNQDITGMYSEDCTFSIMYGDEFESIDLIGLSPEEANIWVTGLNFLIGLIKSPDSLEGREKMREKWLLDVFDEADQDRKGMLDELETIALMKRLNERLCIKSLKQKIVEFEMSKKNGEQRGCISKHAFISLFTQTATRPDIYFILVRYCGRDYMTAEEFQLFLEGEQGVTGTTLARCQEMIDRLEPSDEARARKQLLIDGFTQFIMSEACDIVGTEPRRIMHDMDQPFAHYYIASSNNTYLIEDQVKGPSSCDGYAKALLSGCRCIKIDTHDGPDGIPLVYHGNTLTSKISFSNVLSTIREHAFVASSYPVLLHLENHCTIPLQREMARLLTETFGDLLFVPESLEADGSLDGTNSSTTNSEVKSKSPSVSSTSSNEEADPTVALSASTLSIETNSSGSGKRSRAKSSASNGHTNGTDKQQQSTVSHSHLQHLWSHLTPAQLQNKIIISGKKISRKELPIEEISDEEEESQGEVKDKNGANRKRIALCQELSSLVSLVRNSPGLLDTSVSQPTALHNKNLYEVIHLCESSANKLALSTSGEDLAQRNKLCITQVTPDVSRIDSSNLNPLDFWNCGVQLISMNYQTNGQIMDLYRGWFSQNGSCGYVLKPNFLREKYSTFNARRKDLMPGIDPMNIRIKIISGQQLPRPKGASLKASSIDPYVTVQCLGVPLDCAEARTRTVSNDGHNPIFDESFEFNVHVPELALIRFLVLDDDFINDDFIGQLTIPVSSLHPGFKHVRLQNMNGDIIPNTNLFVKISITNRYGSKQKLRRKRSWSQKHYDTKQVGIKNIDEQLKSAFALVHDVVAMRKNVEKSILDLCDECSLPESANMAQCLRIITLRLASCATIISYKVHKSEYGYPHIKVTGELTPKLSRTMATLDRTLQEFNTICTQSSDYIHSLTEIYKQFSSINYEYHASSKENTNILSNLLDNIRSTSPKYHKDNMLNSDSGNRSGYTSCDEDFSSTGSAGKDSDTMLLANNNINSSGASSNKIGLKFPFSSSSSSTPSSSHQQNSISGSTQNVPNTGSVSTVATDGTAKSASKNTLQESNSSSNSPIGSFRASNRRGEKVTENLFWNLSVIKTELDILNSVQRDCRSAFEQMNRIAESLEHIFEREHKMNLRSNSYVIRELSNVSLNVSSHSQQHHRVDHTSSGGAPSSNLSGGSSENELKLAPLSPATSEGQLRGILKKSTSPTPMAMTSNGTSSSNGRGHHHHTTDYLYSSVSHLHEHHNNNSNHHHHHNHQHLMYSDLSKSLEEKLHSIKNDKHE